MVKSANNTIKKGEKMAIVGFNFTKINAERTAIAQGKLNVSNNVALKDVEESKMPFGKAKALKLTFSFNVNYEPKIGQIVLEGEILYLVDNADKIIEDWKKNKKIPNDLMTEVMNHILTKANIEALLISKEMGMPPPIMLPKVQPKEADKK